MTITVFTIDLVSVGRVDAVRAARRRFVSGTRQTSVNFTRILLIEATSRMLSPEGGDVFGRVVLAVAAVAVAVFRVLRRCSKKKEI